MPQYHAKRSCTVCLKHLVTFFKELSPLSAPMPRARPYSRRHAQMAMPTSSQYLWSRCAVFEHNKHTCSTHAYMSAHACGCALLAPPPPIHTCAHTHTHTLTHARAHTHAHTHTHVYTHNNTHTHRHAHACTLIHPLHSNPSPPKMTQGANPYTPDILGRRTPLHYACYFGSSTCIDALLTSLPARFETSPETKDRCGARLGGCVA